jgi:hypothetical protein
MATDGQQDFFVPIEPQGAAHLLAAKRGGFPEAAEIAPAPDHFDSIGRKTQVGYRGVFHGSSYGVESRDQVARRPTVDEASCLHTALPELAIDLEAFADIAGVDQTCKNRDSGPDGGQTPDYVGLEKSRVQEIRPELA